MNKNTMQTEATKQAFVDTLCQLVCKKPIAKVTVKEIADIRPWWALENVKALSVAAARLAYSHINTRNVMAA